MKRFTFKRKKIKPEENKQPLEPEENKQPLEPEENTLLLNKDNTYEDTIIQDNSNIEKSEDNKAPETITSLYPGRELMHFYTFIEERIGSDVLAEAKEKRNSLGGGANILATLDDLGVLKFKESAKLCFIAFEKNIVNLREGRLSDLIIKKGVPYLGDEQVKPCFMPHVDEKQTQIILPYNDYIEYKRIKNEKNKPLEKIEPSGVHRLKTSGSNFTILDLVSQAKKQGASDIHITFSFSKEQYNILFVIDGISMVQAKYLMNKEQGKRFLVEIKTEAAAYSKGGFNPEISYKAQDATIKFPSLNIDVRVVFIPDGMLINESVTMRLLEKKAIERGAFDFVKEMGYSKKFEENIMRVKEQRNGIFIASGVTGSGKSTLTSRLISTIPITERIYTVEDPIEYIIDGPNVTQHQIYNPPLNPDGTVSDKKMGWKEYITALKRAAPDVVSIGEFRNDPELSKMIVEMSEAGQLVFTTVHIKSAFGIYQALEEVFGIQFEVSAQILLFSTNQVLVRELCPDCKVQDIDYLNRERLQDLQDNQEIRYAYDKNLLTFLSNSEDYSNTYIKGDDCDCRTCGGTGYKGRIPVAEYFKPSQKFIEFLLEEKPKPHAIENWVCQRGIGENKLDRYVQLIKEGRADTSHDIIKKII